MMCDFLFVVDPLSGSFATLVRLPKRLTGFGCRRSRNLGQVSDSYQVVGGGSELKDPTHQSQSSVSGLTQQPHGLQPAKDFFHSFPLTLTNLITRMARRARIDRTSPVLITLGHVRRHLAAAQISDKVFRVVSFVSAQRHTRLLRSLLDQRQRCFSFRSPTGNGQGRIHHQAVAILHKHVSLKGEFRFAALGLLKQSEIRVSGRLMRFIRAFLAMEVHRRIAWVIRLVVTVTPRLILRLETFQARPALDHGSIHGEMFVRQQLFGARHIKHRREELFGDFTLQQAIAVLAESGRVPNLVVHVQAHEPAEQHVVLQLLHQHPFAAHRVKHLQQQRPQQPLRRDRRSPHPRIQLVKSRRQLLKDFIRHLANRAQWMIRRHSLLRRYVAVHARLLFVVSPHSVPPALALDQIIVDQDLVAGTRSVLGSFLMTHSLIFKQGLMGGTLSSAWPLLDLSSHKADLEYAGTKTIENHLLHEVKYSPRGGSDLQIKMFFDQESFQHVRTEYNRVIPAPTGDRSYVAGAETEIRYKMIEEFSDFRKEGGLTLPHTYKIGLTTDTKNGSFSADWTIRLIQFDFNQPIDPTSFTIAAN